MGRYLDALLTPSGRIPRMPYIVLSGLISVLIGLSNVRLHTGDPRNQLVLALMFSLFWPQFCQTSRRLHDCGISAVFEVPLFGLTLLGFLTEIDPHTLGTDEVTIAPNWGALLVLTEIASAVLGAVMIYCMIKGGSAGSNAYGPPFAVGMQTAADVDDAGASATATITASDGVQSQQFSGLDLPGPDRAGIGFDTMPSAKIGRVRTGCAAGAEAGRAGETGKSRLGLGHHPRWRNRRAFGRR